jgi:hypothetical protein
MLARFMAPTHTACVGIGQVSSSYRLRTRHAASRWAALFQRARSADRAPPGPSSGLQRARLAPKALLDPAAATQAT